MFSSRNEFPKAKYKIESMIKWIVPHFVLNSTFSEASEVNKG